MIGFTKTAIAVLSILGAVTAAPTAADTEIDYLSVIEVGPGFPTPQELGLTNADLSKPIPASIVSRDLLSKRAPAACWGNPKCHVNDARACFNYLQGLGGRRCEPSNGRVQMCKIGGCAWDARGTRGSSCSDAALGGAWVLNNCNGGGWVAGTNAAFGNGDMIVDVIGR
ncbi:hypothetical protein DRE_04775 [Drechslerella stenobrocha 248]|uniref:Ecp2 effector protein domain-containing protein n=1 Tax=Drechslerella stenobrocha 248 TaxID=1043628 RepID=W7I0I6_9PEZI|nr:hypothetical protein DRE_04775 [Drechslerella stenobrocha 248]